MHRLIFYALSYLSERLSFVPMLRVNTAIGIHRKMTPEGAHFVERLSP